MPTHIILAIFLSLTVFQADETLRRYGGADREWHLVTLNGTDFDAGVTLSFPTRNRITSQAPCNRYHTRNSAPYPWIEVGPIAAARRACPALQTEQAYFKALQAVNVAVIEGTTLTLSNEVRPLLVFKYRD
ncbi:MAG: META domain-containing protein [Sulfitobacter sp.]